MTMKSLSDRDYELISAYLDGEVDLRQKKAVELRLDQDAQFKSAYDQLSQTRKLLRSQPKLRAPRNYTLSSKTVPASQSSGKAFLPYPSLLRTVSGLASFLFLILFALNWFSGGRMMSVAPMESSEVLPQAAPAEKEELFLSRSAPSEEQPSDEQPMAKSMPPSVPTPSVIYPPTEGIGGMGAAEGGGAEGGVEAPLLEPYSGTLSITPTEVITSALLPSTAEANGEVEIQNEIAPSDFSLSESQLASEGPETELLVEEIRRDWLIKQILFGVLAISFAVIAMRSGKRKV